jgi:hypothetical protein
MKRADAIAKRREKLAGVIAKLAEIRVDRGASLPEEAVAMERLQELRRELISLGRPSGLHRRPRKYRGGRPRKVEVTLAEVRKSRRARILDDL